MAALIATALLSALGLAIALLGIGESTLASHARTTRSLRHASRAASELAVATLRALPSWTAVLAPGATAQVSASAVRFVDGSLTPRAPWDGTPIDLRAMTDAVQSESDTSRPPDSAAQTWRLLAYGPLERAAPGAAGGPWYLVVWVADDPADMDGDPSRDSNGVISLRAEAVGPADAVAATDVTVARVTASTGPERVRVLAIRPR